jgi:capsular exopolysaccharide synthesis family protein
MFARADLARAEEVCQRLLERADMLKTESRAPSRVTVLQEATPPSAPREAAPLRKIATVAIGGFLLPMLLALLWEFRAQRVVRGAQVSHNTVLPLLAEVPTLPARSRRLTTRSGRRVDSQRGTFQDSVHYLCRSLLLSEKARDLQILAVTSAVSKEGKTTLASQLAMSLALYCHQRVLLLDADMRNPSVHKAFDVPLCPGLAQLLADNGSGRVTPDALISEDCLNLVSVLPAGDLSVHPHVILRAGKVETLLRALRDSYRYIIVDTSPVLSAGETLSVCRAADGTLLSVMQHQSRQGHVHWAYHRVLAAGGRPIGVVLNGVSRGCSH